MSDTNFRPARSTGYGAGAGSAPMDDAGITNVGAQHPDASGRSYEAEQRYAEQRRHDEQGYMDRASELADDAWRSGRNYYDQGSRRVSEWADDHPNQLWAAIAIAGAFALWMAYRPIFSSRSGPHFDASRYRYRRLPRSSGRAAAMERGAASAERTRHGM